MKDWNLVINTASDIAEITIYGSKKKVELNTSTSSNKWALHWCVYVQPSFPIDAVDVLFTTKE